MTQQRPRWTDAADGWGASLRPHLASLLFHAGLIGAIVLVATLNVRDRGQVIEVEIIDQPPPPARPEP